MAIEHDSISDSELHEPKGIAGASTGQIYIADGAGSGTFQKLYLNGVEDYNHAGAALTPSAGVDTKVLNDGLGAFTNKTYQLPDHVDIWDTSANQFDFSDLELGDTVDIRFDFTVTTSGANDDCAIKLRMAVGGSPYDLDVVYREWRLAGTYGLTFWYSVYMGDNNTLNNPAEVYVNCSTGSDTVLCNGWYVRTNKRNPVFS